MAIAVASVQEHDSGYTHRGFVVGKQLTVLDCPRVDSAQVPDSVVVIKNGTLMQTAKRYVGGGGGTIDGLDSVGYIPFIDAVGSLANTCLKYSNPHISTHDFLFIDYPDAWEYGKTFGISAPQSSSTYKFPKLRFACGSSAFELVDGYDDNFSSAYLQTTGDIYATGGQRTTIEGKKNLSLRSDSLIEVVADSVRFSPLGLKPGSVNLVFRSASNNDEAGRIYTISTLPGAKLLLGSATGARITLNSAGTDSSAQIVLRGGITAPNLQTGVLPYNVVVQSTETKQFAQIDPGWLATSGLPLHGKADSAVIADSTKKFGNIAGHGKADSAGFADRAGIADSALGALRLGGFQKPYYDTVGNGANRDRANHTGSQAISTVSGLQTELNDKLPLHGTADASIISDSTKKFGNIAGHGPADSAWLSDSAKRAYSAVVADSAGIADSALGALRLGGFQKPYYDTVGNGSNRNRANHTGSQAISTVSGLQDTLNKKIAGKGTIGRYSIFSDTTTVTDGLLWNNGNTVRVGTGDIILDNNGSFKADSVYSRTILTGILRVIATLTADSIFARAITTSVIHATDKVISKNYYPNTTTTTNYISFYDVGDASLKIQTDSVCVIESKHATIRGTSSVQVYGATNTNIGTTDGSVTSIVGDSVDISSGKVKVGVSTDVPCSLYTDNDFVVAGFARISFFNKQVFINIPPLSGTLLYGTTTIRFPANTLKHPQNNLLLPVPIKTDNGARMVGLMEVFTSPSIDFVVLWRWNDAYLAAGTGGICATSISYMY